jgi:ribosomal-protein-alanine N-acetyltransferase
MQLRLLSRLLYQEIQVEDKSLYLRQPMESDFKAWVKLREESKEFLKPWEPLWPEDDLTNMGFRRRLKAYAHQRQSGVGRTYFIFKKENNTLIGGISLTRITHGTTRSAMLGYWMGVQHAGQGNMKKAVLAITKFAFTNLKLKRLEAACVPGNDTSINLLKKCGFSEEGFAREYLEINGTREDHVLFAILPTDYAQQNV